MRFLLLFPLLTSVSCEVSWEVVEKKGADVFSGGCWPGEGDPTPPAGALDYGLTAADIGIDKEDFPYDGIDANCDGKDDFDQDGDGFVPAQFEGVVTLGLSTSGTLPATDCWDDLGVVSIQEGAQESVLTGADIFPGAEEQYYDGIDQDCGGDNDFDQDGDGFVADVFVGLDTQVEGEISLEGIAVVAVEDVLPGGDCWDSLDVLGGPNDAEVSSLVGADIFPNAIDSWYDGIDQDCLGDDDFDQDGDGYISDLYTLIPTYTGGSSLTDIDTVVSLLGTGEVQEEYDCNDMFSDISPSGIEIVADGIDQNCDVLDDCFEDLDLDGYGTEAVLLGTVFTDSDPDVPTLDSCDNGFLSGMMTGLSPYSTDCDDALDSTHPGAAELEDPDALFCMSDVDADGYGDDSPIAGVDAGTDCNDLDVLFSPIASDPAADGLDQNCDTVDSCYYDADSDGIGQNLSYFDALAVQATTADCSGPNESPFNDDCNDNPNNDGAEVYPEVTLSEEQVNNGVFLDPSCDPSIPYAAQPASCIKIAAALELCDGRDNDCSLDIYNPLVNDGIPEDEKDNDSDGHVECAIDNGGWDGSITTSFTSMLGEDCDDGDETIYPLALELCDGQDNNCDTSTPTDEIDDDSDGHVECAIDNGGWDGSITSTFTSMLGEDCNDGDETIYPLALELCDGQDNNCDTSTPTDEIDDDSDGHVECAIDNGGWDGSITATFTSMLGEDCNDGDETIYPLALELCDGQDNNCDTSTPGNEKDDDSDGHVECAIDNGGWDGSITTSFTSMLGEDCDDGDETIYPLALELCDGQDNNCDISIPTDEIDNDGDNRVECTIDADGWDASNGVVAGVDCNDAEETIYTGATELCDGQDNDCDTSLPSDESDDDSDGHVECAIDNGGWDGSITATFTSMLGEDCNDGDETIYPLALELCDGQDNNCDTSTPGNEIDDDSDGHVECAIDNGGWDGSITTSFTSMLGEDCDDGDETIYPLALELCDGQDNNCDTSIPTDEIDNDGDNRVECTIDVDGWDASNGVVAGVDCNDTEDTIYTGATELCDGQDNDCDTSLPSDESDDDSDGHVECAIDNGGWDGSITATFTSMLGEDCDDNEDTVYPLAEELCDGLDNACTGSIEGNERDKDSDGHVECVIDVGGWDGDITATFTVMLGEDCEGSDDTIYPLALELCDGQDNNCDSNIPSNEIDNDGDNRVECTIDVDGWDASNGVVAGVDCNDAEDTIYTGATELCDGQDNDCDTSLPSNESDDDFDGYVECTIDGDGWDGSITATFTEMLGKDCDDAELTVNPGATEICDGQDNDCAGGIPANEIDDDGDAHVECTFDLTGWDGTSAVTGDEDCDDGDETIYPLALELCDGQDNNCDTSIPTDEIDNDGDNRVECTIDADGWDASNGVVAGVDCNDAEDTIYTGATELCDGQDNDCDTSLPSNESDDDFDGYVECTIDGDGWDGSITATFTEMLGKDCDDAELTVNPGATEICDGQDNDCAGGIPANEIDDDGDAHVECTFDLTGWDGTSAVTGDEDCDDGDETIYPLALELCDGQDNNCDTSIPTDEIDNDGDNRVECTIDADGWDASNGVVAGVDCNDAEDTIYTGATELCDGQDNDCDTSLPSDESDDDSDGYVECTIDGDGWDGSITATFTEMLGEDCGDGDVTVNPGATEICDGQDNDCAGGIPSDESDDDSDGYVECIFDVDGWDGASGVTDDEDCDDTDETIYPSATELCDGQDNNCDSSIPSDEIDNDGDNRVECTIDGGGWDESNGVVSGVDCDDTEDTIYTGATELCDGLDNDCDTSLPSNENDGDFDGYVGCEIDDDGWDGSITATFTEMLGGDCDDTLSTTFPGVASNDSTSDCMADADGDDYGDETVPSGVVAGTDCDDSEATTYPYADESTGDDVDSNCDGLGVAVDDISTTIDETIDCNGAWHIDTSGAESVYLLACNTAPAGYTAASAICTETGMYDGVASLLSDNSHAEQEDLLDLFKDPSGSFGLSGSPITNNTDYNHWLSYTGFNAGGNNGSWADGSADAPNWESGKPDGSGNTCTAGFYNSTDGETQVYNQDCSNSFELLSCSYRMN